MNSIVLVKLIVPVLFITLVKGTCNTAVVNSDVLEHGKLRQFDKDQTNVQDPVKFYQIGRNGRTELMHAVIKKSHIGKGSATGNNAQQYIQSMDGIAGVDDAGHILANTLGGSGTDRRNLFPQQKGCNKGAWRDIETAVKKMVNGDPQNRGVPFTVQLKYENDAAKRPYEIVYYARDPITGDFCGDVTNPKTNFYPADSMFENARQNDVNQHVNVCRIQ